MNENSESILKKDSSIVKVHFPLPENVALFEMLTVRVLRFASVKWRDRGSKHRNKRSNFRLHRPSSHRKNESN